MEYAAGMKMKKDTVLIRIRRSTRKRLRILAAMQDKSIMDVVEELANLAQDRIKAEQQAD